MSDHYEGTSSRPNISEEELTHDVISLNLLGIHLNWLLWGRVLDFAMPS